MKPFVALSVVALFVTYACASSFATIPLKKLRKAGEYLGGYPEATLARAASFKSRTGDGATTIPATNRGYVQYTTRVGIGHPPTYYDLIVDTGSSLTFCGTGIPYARTSSSIPTGRMLSDTYGLGYFNGPEYRDEVSLAPHLVIKNQSIGFAKNYSHFHLVDGILGLGPADLSRNTIVDDPHARIPTIMDNLISQRLIEHNVIGVHFATPAFQNETNGSVTIGGVNATLYQGELVYFPLTKTAPASDYWGINVTSVTYGNSHPLIRTSAAGVVDSGTSPILFADDIFKSYMAAIPGAEWDDAVGLMVIPLKSAKSLQPLHFEIGNETFTLDATAQLVPEDENEAWGGAAGNRYSKVGKFGFSSRGLNFLLGQAFMEKYYTVFDAESHRVGFAMVSAY